MEFIVESFIIKFHYESVKGDTYCYFTDGSIIVLAVLFIGLEYKEYI